jgi:hypothetical protein
MDITMKGRVGPATSGTGSHQTARLATDAAVVVAPAHGPWAEYASRGLVFAGMTALGGTTVVAANNSPVAAAAATILSLYNPLNSQLDIEVIATKLAFVSGTPAAGAWVYNIAYNQAITAIQNNGGTTGARPVSANGGGSGVGVIYTQTALTGGVGAQVLYRPIGNALFAGAIAATTPNLGHTDEVNGEIVLPPGGLLTVASPGTGTTVIVAAGFVWLERERA